MMRYEKLRNNLYSADLVYGKIDLKRSHGFSCYFIVEHMDDEEFIRDQALQLLLSGCRDFVFYGKKEATWHLGVDEADIMLYPDMSDETLALTSSCETLEEFVDDLHHAISERPFLSHDYYLFYDDSKIYHDAIELLFEGASL